MTPQDLAQIQTLVTSARRVLILTHRDPSIDTMASVLALYLALAKMGKDVTAAMESQPLVEVSNLVGIDKVKTTLDGQNLVVTYKPYSMGDFEKVSYAEDQGTLPGQINDSFKLTITPREGYVPDPKNFQFSYSGGGGTFDLLITIEVLEPTQVGALFDANLFSTVPIINIDTHDPNKDYGKFNLVEPEAVSLSEIVTFFLRAIGATMDLDIANNLYQGIVSATSNFQSPKVAAATFEAAAICLREKAKANQPKPGMAAPQPPQQPVMAPQQPMNPNMAQPQMPQQPQQPMAPTQPQVNPNMQPNSVPQAGQPMTGQSVPADWTQPKAYRGTSTI